MTPEEARQILLVHRPSLDETADPQTAEALALARRDPELGCWFRDHCAFQNAIREKFRQIEVPDHLKAGLLSRLEAESKIVRPAFWSRRPVWLSAAAAATVLLFGLITWRSKPAVPDRFANYEAHIVGSAIREYKMDIRTNNLQAVRESLAARGAPRDYAIPNGLQRLTLTGGGALRWRSHPVAMVCYDRGDGQMLFLFVMNRSAVQDPPPETPATSLIRGLFTATWSQGDKTYLLAGPQEAGFLQKYF